jgi:hypothetical protein
MAHGGLTEAEVKRQYRREHTFPTECLTEAEVERQYGREYSFLTKKRLQNWRYLRRGGPKFLKVSRSIFYPREEIERFIAACLVDTSQEYHAYQQRAR